MFVSKKKHTHVKNELLDEIQSARNRLRANDKELNTNKQALISAENALQESQAKCKALENEFARLAELLTARSGDCKVGPWCDGCKHKGVEQAHYSYKAEIPGSPPPLKWINHGITGKVIFCKKHIHEICGEFETPEKVAFSQGCPCVGPSV